MKFPNNELLETELARVPSFHRKTARECFEREEAFMCKNGENGWKFFGIIQNPVLVHPGIVHQAHGFPSEIEMWPFRLKLLRTEGEMGLYLVQGSAEPKDSRVLHLLNKALERWEFFIGDRCITQHEMDEENKRKREFEFLVRGLAERYEKADAEELG
jgi:hypothetical protein